jgi:Lon protease-like protein
MPTFHPGFDALPAEIPVFPLPGALLLPQGRLPLNVFEPRYLAMVTDALGAGRMFGMIQPRPDARRTTNGPGLYGVGCLGRLTSFAETEDGRFLITLTGMIRFGVVEEVGMRRGYRRVRADYAPWRADLDIDAPPPALDRAALLAASCGYFRARGIEVNHDAVQKAADAMLVTTLSMVCPFEVREKQALLEAPDTAERARMLVALLQMGAHGHGATPPGGGRPS